MRCNQCRQRCKQKHPQNIYAILESFPLCLEMLHRLDGDKFAKGTSWALFLRLEVLGQKAGGKEHTLQGLCMIRGDGGRGGEGTQK